MTRALLALILLTSCTPNQAGGVKAPFTAKRTHEGEPTRPGVAAPPAQAPASPRRVPSASRSRPTFPSTAAAVADGSRATGTLNWTALGQCESGGDPRAVSATGKYRGLVQFSLSSWHAVGMTGDPIDYPAAVQIDAARRLLRLQGRGAWPVCGRHL